MLQDTPLPPVCLDIEEGDSPREMVLKQYINDLEIRYKELKECKEKLSRKNKRLLTDKKEIKVKLIAMVRNSVGFISSNFSLCRILR